MAGGWLLTSVINISLKRQLETSWLSCYSAVKKDRDNRNWTTRNNREWNNRLRSSQRGKKRWGFWDEEEADDGRTESSLLLLRCLLSFLCLFHAVEQHEVCSSLIISLSYKGIIVVDPTGIKGNLLPADRRRTAYDAEIGLPTEVSLKDDWSKKRKKFTAKTHHSRDEILWEKDNTQHKELEADAGRGITTKGWQEQPLVSPFISCLLTKLENDKNEYWEERGWQTSLDTN